MAEKEERPGLHRPQLFRLAAAGAALGSDASLAKASPSEVADAISPQPAPRFDNDPNTSDILVETLIAWGRVLVIRSDGEFLHGGQCPGVARKRRLVLHIHRRVQQFVPFH
jgi:hypothetical protein